MSHFTSCHNISFKISQQFNTSSHSHPFLHHPNNLCCYFSCLQPVWFASFPFTQLYNTDFCIHTLLWMDPNSPAEIIYTQTLTLFWAHLHSDWMFSLCLKTIQFMQEIKEVFDEHCNLEERKGDSNKGEKSVEGEGRKVRRDRFRKRNKFLSSFPPHSSQLNPI